MSSSAEAASAQSAAERRDHRVGWLCLLFTSVAWGLNWPVVKFLVGELPPLTSRYWCALLATAAAAGMATLRRESLRIPRGELPRVLTMSALNVAVYMGLTGVAVVWLPATEAVTFAYTMPIWATVLSWPVLGERPGLRQCVGLLLGFAGIMLLAGGAGTVTGSVWDKLPGIAAVLMASVLFSLGTVLSKRLPVTLPPLSSVAWQFGLACVPLWLLALWLERPDFSRLTYGGVMAILFSGLVPLCLAYLTWFAALRRLPAATASMGTLLSPVVGVAVSAWFLGEPLGWRQLTALGMTLAGVALAMRAPAGPRQGGVEFVARRP